MVIAETGIRKPDSVLEYTCFDQTANVGANEIHKIFGRQTGNPTQSVQNLVIKSFTEYLNKNFAHKFLGRDSGTDYTPNSSATSYNCTSMNLVNFYARCMNFVQDNMDFVSFTTLANSSADPRILPSQYKCSGTEITQDLIDVSQNKDLKYVNFDTFDDYKKIAVDTPCADPVDTGLIAISSKFVGWSGVLGGPSITEEKKPHKTCVNPLCYYDPAGDKCEER